LTIADQPIQGARPKVYLAGPGVFRPDAQAHLARLAAVCERHGLLPLLPTDDCGGAVSDPLAKRIYAANTQMLRSADGVLADLQEWRGHEPDSGTAFEVGFAAALQLPIVAYGAPDAPYADRVSRTRPCARDARGTLRESGSLMAVEDFGMPMNLMLGCSAILMPSADEAIALLASLLAGRQAPRQRQGSFDHWLQAEVLNDAARHAAAPVPGETSPADPA
jgi:nucleoside 2-deoxyribosyltransferase